MSVNQDRYCSVLLAGNVSAADQARLAGQKAALLLSTKWTVGEVIAIRFLGGSAALQERVKRVAREWTKLANVTFNFVDAGPADIRIAFMPGKGSWSYLGTMCRRIAEPQPTMNYGWLTDASPESELRRVVLHEFGHALGLIHEHQNPKDGGIEWNRAAVKRDLSGPPNNWDDDTIENNMFAKYAPGALAATGVDASSIMMYPIPKAWTLDGTSAGLNPELSDKDKQFIATNYPK
jgi:serralysin